MRDKRGCTPARHWSTTAPTRTAASAEFSTMESKTVLITPDIAENLLANNSINRPFNKANLAYLKNQLLSNHWKLTHQGIAISKNGNVLDGQHRLKIVVETGMSVEMLVTSDLEEDVFSVLDTGKRRDGSDVLSINGATNTHCMSAGIKNYLLYNRFKECSWRLRAFVCNTEVLNEYQLDPSGWQWTTCLAHGLTLKGILLPGPFNCFLYLARQQGHKAAALEIFAKKVNQGLELSKGNPIHAFRNRCIVSTTKRRDSQQWLANYIKLFNHVVRGDEIVVFKDQLYPPMPSIVKAN